MQSSNITKHIDKTEIMYQIFKTKKRYAKKSLAKRIKVLNSVSKTHVQQDSSCSKGTLPMTDDNTTPPLFHKMSNNLKTNLAILIFLSDFM